MQTQRDGTLPPAVTPSSRFIESGFGPGIWPLRERLALATSLRDSNNQQLTWHAVSRRLLEFTPLGRPPTWCSSRACAKQYALLLDSAEMIRKEKQMETYIAERRIAAGGFVNANDAYMPKPIWNSSSLDDYIIKRLTSERVEELRSSIKRVKVEHESLKKKLEALRSRCYSDEEILELWNRIQRIDDDEPPNDIFSSPDPSVKVPEESSSRNSEIDRFIYEIKSLSTSSRIPETTWAFSNCSLASVNGRSSSNSLNPLSTLEGSRNRQTQHSKQKGQRSSLIGHSKSLPHHYQQLHGVSATTVANNLLMQAKRRCQQHQHKKSNSQDVMASSPASSISVDHPRVAAAAAKAADAARRRYLAAAAYRLASRFPRRRGRPSKKEMLGKQRAERAYYKEAEEEAKKAAALAASAAIVV
ncbi:unnamed protein product [Protopolystoma xenopodis]|uniref:Myb-like domain-containing protein n=1 Tax=Protopolystoma xenopodis TaxID=117903 RepID=A0A3S5A7A6_9PLAT|nr:unnamed protein product [Protopolystoma xenopodis]